MSEDSREMAYSKPPIVEATIELRYVETINDQKVKKASDRLAGRYTTISAEEKIEANFDFVKKVAQFRTVSPLYRLTSDDQADVLLLLNNSAGWTRRAPYEGWAAFFGRMAEEFEILDKIWGTRRLERIGLRFINRLDIPRSDDGLCHDESYLAYHLHAGPLDPYDLYQWLVQKAHRDRGMVSVVQSQVVEPEIPGTLAVTLDIDIGVDVEVPSRKDDILAKLGDMRVLKNEIFEAGITPLARKIFA